MRQDVVSGRQGEGNTDIRKPLVVGLVDGTRHRGRDEPLPALVRR